MLSYKKWKKINENFGYNLGVKTPNKIANLQSKWDEMGMSMSMPMKLKKSKKMFGGDDGPEMGSSPDAHLGGDSGAPELPMKKNKHKKPFHDEVPDDDMGDEDMDMDDEVPDDGDEDMDMDDEVPDDDMGDEAPEDDLGDDDKNMGKPDMDMAKPKGKNSFVDKTKSVADGAKLMHKGAKKMIKGMKEGTLCPKCKKASCKCSRMTKEESEFWRSLQSQTGATKFAKDTDGSWSPVTEDAVIPPHDPNADIIEDEAGPGEAGYAPQGRIGSFTEWSDKYKRKSK